MAVNNKYAQTQPFTLAGAGASITATSVTLNSFTDPDGNLLTMTDFGSIGYGTIEPGSNTNEEQISFSGITQNGGGTATLTGVRSITFVYPYTSTSGLSKTHAGGTVFVISNTSGFYSQFATLANDQEFTGTNTFDISPIVPDPTNATDAANKEYVDGQVAAGAPNASTTVKGIVQEATQAQQRSKTATGSTGARLYTNPSTTSSTLLSDYVADTGAANAYAIAPSPAIVAYVAGQTFSFIAANANTTTSTLNVNGLGTKNILKRYNTALAANDILANQMVCVEYDGTQFQLMIPVGNAPQLLASISTTTTLGTSDTLYPSQNAVKTYVDNTNILKSVTSTDFEASGRFTSIVNSGTNSYNTNGLVMDTTVTTTRNAGITWAVNPAGAGDTYAGNPIFTCSFTFANVGTTGSSYFGIGTATAAGSGHTYTLKHAGFKVLIATSTASLYATQADGSTETASSALTTITANDWVDVALQVVGSSSVNYWWRLNGGAWSAATNLATHVPTSSSLGLQFSVSNNSTATENIVNVTTASYQRN